MYLWERLSYATTRPNWDQRQFPKEQELRVWQEDLCEKQKWSFKY